MTTVDPQVGKDFIEHFGTKGMRWGVRKERTDYGHGKSKGEKDGKKAKKSGPTEKKIVGKTKTTGKDINNLSDAQLQKLNNRLNMEQQYARLTATGPSKTRRVLSSVAKFGSEAARGVAMTQVKNLGNAAIAPQTAKVSELLGKKLANKSTAEAAKKMAKLAAKNVSFA